MNITLIGMAGAGKSYIGKQLAQKLGFGWVDSDVLLSEKYGKDIQSILDELGEKKYVRTEGELAIKHMKGKDSMILSPAGSIIYNSAWLDHSKDISTIVYLQVPFELVEARLMKVPPRAIIGLGRKSLRELYNERHPLYKMNADLTIETDKLSSEEIVATIVRFVELDGV